MARCGYVTNGGVRYWLPQCMGGAVYGKDGCTCPSEPKNNRKGLEDRVKSLEEEVRSLKALIQAHIFGAGPLAK